MLPITLSNLYYTGIDVSEKDKNIAYITMAGFTAGCKVFKTSDGGSTWQNVSYNLPNIPVNCIKFIPGSNNVMIATDLGIYTLANSSLTWTNQSTGLPNVIISDIEFNPSLNKVYLSTFGRGIWASDLSAFTDTTTSIKTDKAEANDFSLYPSVSTGNFKITNAQIRTFEIAVIDVSGKIVYTETLNGKKEYSFNLSLSPGLYYARITNDKTMEVKRFIIE